MAKASVAFVCLAVLAAVAADEQTCGAEAADSEGCPGGSNEETSLLAFRATSGGASRSSRRLEVPPPPLTPPSHTTPLESCLRGPGSSEWTYMGHDEYLVEDVNGNYSMKDIHNKRVTGSIRPSAVVFASTELHVEIAVYCGYLHGKPVYGRSGMNQYEASCAGVGARCILVDTSNLMKFRWPSSGCDSSGSDSSCRVSMGPGLSLGSAYVQMSERNYALPAGTCAQVRVAGLTLGGGKGWLTRKYGLTLDRLVGIDAVLLNGTKVRARKKSEPHLFWLARGGGGNIFPGIVTAFHFNLVPMPQSPGTYSMSWSWTALNATCRGKVMAQWYEQLAVNPDLDLFSRISLQNFGNPQILIDMYYYGADKSGMEEKLQKVDSAACGGGEMGTPNSTDTWINIVAKGNGLTPDNLKNIGINCGWNLTEGSKPTRTTCYGFDDSYTLRWAYRSLVLGMGGVPQEVWDTIGSQQMYNNFYIEFDPSNGVTADVASTETAYPYRDKGFVTMQQVMRYDKSDPTETRLKEQMKLSATMMTELTKLVPARGYYNYLDMDMSSYGATPRDVYYSTNADTVEAYLKEYTEGLDLQNGCQRCDSWELKKGS